MVLEINVTSTSARFRSLAAVQAAEAGPDDDDVVALGGFRRPVIASSLFDGERTITRLRGGYASSLARSSPASSIPFTGQREIFVNHFVFIRHECAEASANPAPHRQANNHTRMLPAAVCSGVT